ncbi:MAG: peroxidase [Acidobacteria bacterium]|nr:peroxidase [Acidobacteriota bacterium]
MEALSSDYVSAAPEDLAPHDRAMLDYAARLTREPWAMTREDVERLRAHGFADRGILEINLAAGYMAFANRLADGLGVELEDFWERGPR